MSSANLNQQHFSSAEDAIRHIGSRSLSDHPLVKHIARTNDGGLLWLLIDNTYRGTSVNFAAWLAWVTATVDDDRARSLLARQLNEEMGNGNVEQAHARLMTAFLEGIAPLRPTEVPEELIAPGQKLSSSLMKHYKASDQYEALAALMAGEICAHQIIASVGQLIRPHLASLDPRNLTWLTHHNEVEGDHAAESLELARSVPSDPKVIESVVRGAFGVHDALWTSMDELLVSAVRRG